uniref:Reverse transcriptase domain-containing protein n=1 Tax=Cyprinus carpio TaxID=7962 RepID=A0A8C2PX63_CYPCA
PTLSPALTHINTSLLTGIFPTSFKQARETPLLKKPTLNTLLVDSYRPVSLLPFIAKTLEQVVFSQVSLFLSQNNHLGINQSSSEGAIQLRRHYCQSLKHCRLQKLIPNHQFSFCWIYLPLLTLNHQILLSALSSLGITGIPLHWFESYLTGRSFRVAWGGEVSKAHQLVTGVPQGSVLGPLLFSIYTTSLGSIIQAHVFSHCYADDTKLYLSFQPDDPMVAASGCLADISAWMKEHHLQLNRAKTEFPCLSDFTA